MPKLESYKRVHTEELYFPNDQKLWKEQQEALVLLEKFNQTSVTQPEQQNGTSKKNVFRNWGKLFYSTPFLC
jgi:galactoside O-acetyltransferase